MTVEFSNQVLEELEARKSPRSLVEPGLQSPERKVPDATTIMGSHSRGPLHGKASLLRVMGHKTANPPKVVTVSRASTIAKDWRKP